jgi:hypothetical protein
MYVILGLYCSLSFDLTCLQIVGSMGCSVEMLDIISQLVYNIKPTDHPLFLEKAHKKTLDEIESELRSLQQIYWLCDENNINPRKDMVKSIAELYRLAALIYLERVGRGYSKFSPTTEELVDDAFAILSKLDWCERPWPLFIVACEAQTDQRRKLILDLLNKTQEVRNYGNLESTRSLIQSAWIQDDLYREPELSCFAKYNAVMSAFEGLPSFT